MPHPLHVKVAGSSKEQRFLEDPATFTCNGCGIL
jgi:hypothetical protein